MNWSYINIYDLNDDEYKYWFSKMNEAKQLRVKKFLNENDIKRSIAGDMLARKMISNECNISPEKIQIINGVFGKPQLKNFELNFNISHSNEIVTCCTSQNPIGIDVEEIVNIKTNLLSKVCTDDDFIFIFGKKTHSLEFKLSKNQLKKFYEIWTTKEAYFKCIGTGIIKPKSISIKDLNNTRKTFYLNNYIITIVEDK